MESDRDWLDLERAANEGMSEKSFEASFEDNFRPFLQRIVETFWQPGETGDLEQVVASTLNKIGDKQKPALVKIREHLASFLGEREWERLEQEEGKRILLHDAKTGGTPG